jgi:hypothetical protein
MHVSRMSRGYRVKRIQCQESQEYTVSRMSRGYSVKRIPCQECQEDNMYNFHPFESRTFLSVLKEHTSAFLLHAQFNHIIHSANEGVKHGTIMSCVIFCHILSYFVILSYMTCMTFFLPMNGVCVYRPNTRFYWVGKHVIANLTTLKPLQTIEHIPRVWIEPKNTRLYELSHLLSRNTNSGAFWTNIATTDTLVSLD